MRSGIIGLTLAITLQAADLPTVSVQRTDGQTRIAFTGTLQSADSVTGPWTTLTNALSPFTPPAQSAGKFYRTRVPESIFAADSIVAFSITGPFQEYFEKAHAGMPDGIIPPIREKPYFDGTLSIAGFTLPVSARVRGNSSLQECPFPKLKFKVAKTQRPGTPFADAREVKIGTHCAEGGRGPIGRLRDERSAYREALAYEVMHVLGFIAPRVRRARIEYHDTSAAKPDRESGWSVLRNAAILDDVEVVAERLGGRALSDEEVGALTNAGFSDQLLTDLHLLHTLLGNWDYSLAQDGRNLWNTDVIELADESLAPVAGDFDLASFVTEIVRLNAPHDYHPELSDLDRQARYQLEQLKGRTGTSFAAAAARFESHRADIEAVIASAEVDEPGRANALQHVAVFFDALNIVLHPPGKDPRG